MQQEVEHVPNIAIGRILCVLHGVQNMVKKSVKTLDKNAPTPQYSTQAMRSTNVWRSFGHHKKLKDVAVGKYGKEVADIHFSACIGKIMGTRWGTYDGPERKYLR
jgi:hypothetical protein